MNLETLPRPRVQSEDITNVLRWQVFAKRRDGVDASQVSVIPGETGSVRSRGGGFRMSDSVLCETHPWSRCDESILGGI